MEYKKYFTWRTPVTLYEKNIELKKELIKIQKLTKQCGINSKQQISFDKKYAILIVLSQANYKF